MASFSGLFDNITPPGASVGYTPVSSQRLSAKGVTATPIEKNSQEMTRIAKVLRTRGMKRHVLYLMQLIGAAPGSINGGAAFTEQRVAHPPTGVSGTLELGAFTNRSAAASTEAVTILAASTSSTSTDVTNLKAGFRKIFAFQPSGTPTQANGVAPAVSVEDASGNGGGGRLTAAYKLK